nr:unnamed protein product [Digitaria exilis]
MCGPSPTGVGTWARAHHPHVHLLGPPTAPASTALDGLDSLCLGPDLAPLTSPLAPFPRALTLSRALSLSRARSPAAVPSFLPRALACSCALSSSRALACSNAVFSSRSPKIEAARLSTKNREDREKMAEIQQSLADKKIEAARLTHEAAQEQTKCKMLETYTQLLLAPTDQLSENALAERNFALESMRLALFPKAADLYSMDADGSIDPADLYSMDADGSIDPADLYSMDDSL